LTKVKVNPRSYEEIDWKSEASRGSIKRLKVQELRSYAERHNMVLGKVKKAELVQLVTDHIQKQ
jgi:hypothetical protein